MAEPVLLPDRVPSLGRAVEQFLAAKPLSPNARRSYAYCLGAVVSTSAPVLLWAMSLPNVCEGSSSSAGATRRLRRGTAVWPRWGRSAAGHRLRVG